MNLKSIMLGRALHSLLSGIGLQVAGALFGALGGGLWSLSALGHVALGAVVTGISSYVVRQTPTWLAWLAKALGAPPAAPTSSAGILLVLLAAAAMSSCSPPAADAAPVLTSGPVGLAGALLAPGDSLGPYTFTVAPVAGASGYSWTVTASGTNGTFTNLPTGTATASPSLSFTLATGGIWDSVSLQLCVKGTSSVRSTKAAACTSWKVYRYLSSPTALSGDSSKLGPISLMLRSPSEDSLFRNGSGVYARVAVGGTAQFCAFIRFGSGHVAAITAASACPAVAAANFAAPRLTGYTAAESAWLSGSCATWASCLAGVGLLRQRADILVHRA